MKPKTPTERPQKDSRPSGPAPEDESAEFRVEDRRHWQLEPEDAEQEPAATEPRRPSVIDEYRERAERAEAKLQEYIEAFKQHQAEQEKVRARLQRDVDRKVALQFAELVGRLLETVDALELSLSHVAGVAEAEPLAKGVAMARDRFLAILERSGIERIVPDGEVFDPNVAEALRVDPVDSAEHDGKVTETLQPGFRLGDHVIRAARVAVGGRQSS